MRGEGGPGVEPEALPVAGRLNPFRARGLRRPEAPLRHPAWETMAAPGGDRSQSRAPETGPASVPLPNRTRTCPPRKRPPLALGNPAPGRSLAPIFRVPTKVFGASPSSPSLPPPCVGEGRRSEGSGGRETGEQDRRPPVKGPQAPCTPFQAPPSFQTDARRGPLPRLTVNSENSP